MERALANPVPPAFAADTLVNAIAAMGLVMTIAEMTKTAAECGAVSDKRLDHLADDMTGGASDLGSDRERSLGPGGPVIFAHGHLPSK
jgi:hypothetical protein